MKRERERWDRLKVLCKCVLMLTVALIQLDGEYVSHTHTESHILRVARG